MKQKKSLKQQIDIMLDLYNLNKILYMKLKHINKRVVKNSLFRVINDLNGKMYPSGLKEEVKYVEDLSTALNCKYSKVEIANMLRRIMSYVILTKSPVCDTAIQAKKVVKTISEKDMEIVTNYIVINNQYIGKLNCRRF